MYEKILVPLDGSDTAERVLPYAEEMAARLGSEAVLVSVVNPLHADEENLRRTYLAQLVIPVQSHCREYNSQSACQVSAHVVAGKPADQVLLYANQINASLIILSNLGSSSGDQWSLGSVAAKIVRAMDRPVLLVRSQAREVNVFQKKLIQKILVPLDGSKRGESAVPLVADIAGATGAEVILLQVIEPIRIVGGYDTIATGSFPPGEEEIKTDATKYLQESSRFFIQKNIKTSCIVAMGSAAEQIIDYAEANLIDMIGISSHGESGIRRWVFGSVTDKVLHAGNTPVLVVKSIKV